MRPLRCGPRWAATLTAAFRKHRTELFGKNSPRVSRRWQCSLEGEVASGNLEKPWRPLAKSYDPSIVERGWFEWWKQQGFFTPRGNDGERFTMLSPPPNVTGDLHIGHALTFTIQDAIARYRRMSGESVLWIPGMDHAGIGTQSVIERKLWKEQKLTKHDLGRAKFIDYIWDWKEKHGGRIIQQLSYLGASLDYGSLFFTMDPPRSDAVRKAFVRLHEHGLLYRDNRIVNWCCSLGTVISDVEVEYEDVEGRTYLEIPGRATKVEFGVLHSLAYPLAPKDGRTDGSEVELVVTTTRPETVLGDVAVAVHPDDPRYKHLHGRHVLHPLLKTPMPIICDADLVDMELGTGAVKITPAHDIKDFDCGMRHSLPVRSVIDKSGRMSANCRLHELVGKDRFDVRREIITLFLKEGLYRGRSNEHKMRVARCSKSGDIVEPMVLPQWYINYDELAANLVRAIDAGELQFHPEFHSNVLKKLIENAIPWCISRQLWWGHQIPAYRVEFDEPSAGAPRSRLVDSKGDDIWFVALDEASAKKQVDAYLQGKSSGHYRLAQDEDVLDTWFSSSLLPLTALGWRVDDPIPTRYPISLMETGLDILYFWVARMAMLCGHFSGMLPFPIVQLHGVVRDSQGRKMSKSLGNVIDPLHVIHGVNLETLKKNIKNSNLSAPEIKKSLNGIKNEFPDGIKPFGADSLRFALCSYTKENHFINMKMDRLVLARRFCIKLWNLINYTLMQMESASYRLSDGGSFPQLRHLEGRTLSLGDRYAMSRLARAVDTCAIALKAGDIGVATDAARKFIKDELCDVYVEFSKLVLYGVHPLERKMDTLHVLVLCADVSLRLLHPLMPFITEELWQHLKRATAGEELSSNASIMAEQFPTPELFSRWKSAQDEDESYMNELVSLNHAARQEKRSGAGVGESGCAEKGG